jgi:2-hydroxychromene-2-carboxylate isomerase
MVLQLADEQKPALIHPVFRAYWALDRDIGDDTVLAEIATAEGLDGPALVAGTKLEPIKERLKAATEKAVRAGLFGAPSFLVGDLLFWGQDRLVFVEKALQGWRPRGE